MRLDAPPPRAISIPITRAEVRVRGFSFPVAEQADLPAAPHAAASPAASTARPARHHADRAAGTISKLEDRLGYLLQPSLESILAQRSLEIPFPPFGYQLEGVAFLYPRHAAVLADEMGLGKTMQAITAIRLLLRCGEVRRVLVVCPKPLVTNWQREFAQWAPEIPVMVWKATRGDGPGSGSGRMCRCGSPTSSWSAATATSATSRPVVLQFDLVVLDESQRIKNRAGTTSQVVRSIGRRRSWALTGTPVENSAADLVGIFEFLAPGLISDEMKPRRMARHGERLRAAPHQGPGAGRPAAQTVPRCELELTPRSGNLSTGRGRGGRAPLGDGQRGDHPARVRAGAAAEADLQLRPGHRASSKLERLEADLEEVAASRRKAIVFSQWVDTIRRLSPPLARSIRWSITARSGPAAAKP